MYSAVHSAVGIGLAVSGYALTGNWGGAAVGFVAATISHDWLDRLFGEHGYGSLSKTLAWEGIPLLVFALSAWLSGPLWWVFAIGWLGGNLFDLIDKKLGLSILFPSKFPATTYIPCHKVKPRWKLSLKATQALAVLSTLFVLTLGLLL